MCASFKFLALVKHNDLISISDCAEAMSDNDDCLLPTLNKFVESSLYKSL